MSAASLLAYWIRVKVTSFQLDRQHPAILREMCSPPKNNSAFFLSMIDPYLIKMMSFREMLLLLPKLGKLLAGHSDRFPCYAGRCERCCRPAREGQCLTSL